MVPTVSSEGVALSMKPEFSIPEDRSDLAELLTSNEREAISITFSDGKTITFPNDCFSIRKASDAHSLEVCSTSMGKNWSLDIDEIVRVNCVRSGELLWETRRGQLFRPVTPELKRLQNIARFYFPVFTVVMLNFFLGWNLFGEWDGIATMTGFAGAMLLVSLIPRPSEIV